MRMALAGDEREVLVCAAAKSVRVVVEVFGHCFLSRIYKADIDMGTNVTAEASGGIQGLCFGLEGGRKWQQSDLRTAPWNQEGSHDS